MKTHSRTHRRATARAAPVTKVRAVRESFLVRLALHDMAVLDDGDEDYAADGIAERGPPQKMRKLAEGDVAAAEQRRQHFGSADDGEMQMRKTDAERDDPNDGDLTDGVARRRQQPRQQPHQQAGKHAAQEYHP